MDTSSLHGGLLTPPEGKPEFTLTSTDGRPYDFRRNTDGHLTLLYFGYTHCPDVCPIHMSNIAAALRRLPAAERRQVRVIFVTTDPERDTPAVLRAWLDHFDSSFVGLDGTPAALGRVQAMFGMPPAVKSMSDASTPKSVGAYGMGHFGGVLAFTPDDSLRVTYPLGVSVDDWATDLSTLMRIGAD